MHMLHMHAGAGGEDGDREGTSVFFRPTHYSQFYSKLVITFQRPTPRWNQKKTWGFYLNTLLDQFTISLQAKYRVADSFRITNYNTVDRLYNEEKRV
jgi:hypothetical protein